jgi:DNA-binding response OmpR family regulator
MKLKRTYLFIAISSLALFFVLIIQVNWIFKTAGIKEELFNEKANMVLSRTTEALRADKETCSNIGESVENDSSLSDHRNHVIKRKEMLHELWGVNDYFLGRSLDVFITKIRKYLMEDPNLSIENVFGVGFIFNVPEK